MDYILTPDLYWLLIGLGLAFISLMPDVGVFLSFGCLLSERCKVGVGWPMLMYYSNKKVTWNTETVLVLVGIVHFYLLLSGHRQSGGTQSLLREVRPKADSLQRRQQRLQGPVCQPSGWLRRGWCAQDLLENVFLKLQKISLLYDLCRYLMLYKVKVAIMCASCKLIKQVSVSDYYIWVQIN